MSVGLQGVSRRSRSGNESIQAVIRPIDEMVKVGDPAKLNALGWSPRRPVRQTLKDILEYWRGQESLGSAESKNQRLTLS